MSNDSRISAGVPTGGQFSAQNRQEAAVELPEPPVEALTAESEHVLVTLEYIGEGWNGDYDPEDPDDDQLLRVTVSSRTTPAGEWEPVERGSWCTDLTRNVDRSAAQTWMNASVRDLNAHADDPESFERHAQAFAKAATRLEDHMLV